MDSQASPPETLLQELALEFRSGCLVEWYHLRVRLQVVLHHHLPGQKIWLFGSLLAPERFHPLSDVDLAVESLPSGRSIYELTSLMAEDLQRRVDIVDLRHSRLAAKILRDGELWIV